MLKHLDGYSETLLTNLYNIQPNTEIYNSMRFTKKKLFKIVVAKNYLFKIHYKLCAQNIVTQLYRFKTY